MVVVKVVLCELQSSFTGTIISEGPGTLLPRANWWADRHLEERVDRNVFFQASIVRAWYHFLVLLKCDLNPYLHWRLSSTSFAVRPLAEFMKEVIVPAVT